jgi:hypothetical protein
MRWIVFSLMIVSAAATAEAGPFRRSVTRTSSSACSGGNCVSTRTVTRSHGAQGHAEAMAESCSMVHASSHDGTYEGVGVGGSPAAALSSCCNNGGQVLEEGVARGRDGRWYACRRYSLR